MEKSVNQLIDRISSINPERLKEFSDLLEFKRQLLEIKTSAQHQGYGGKVIINYSDELNELIEFLIVNSKTNYL